MKTLICDISDGNSVYSENRDQTSSPVQCMEKAFSEAYDLIVVAFATQTIKQRNALVELCALLKRTPQTGQTPILAVLTAKHRPLLEALKRVNVEYAKILADETGLPGEMAEADIRNLTAADAIAHALLELCPFAGYQQIDASREMAICNAYYSRLVISGNRLAQTCQHPDFKSCPYFQSPKISNAQKYEAGINPEVFYDVLQSIS